MAFHLTPGDQVWVRGTVREQWPGEVHLRLEFQSARMVQSICVSSADIIEQEPTTMPVSESCDALAFFAVLRDMQFVYVCGVFALGIVAGWLLGR
jgi:hypothetical protein